MADNTSPLEGEHISLSDAAGGLLADLPETPDRPEPEHISQQTTDQPSETTEQPEAPEPEAASEETPEEGQEPEPDDEATAEPETEEDDLPSIDPPAHWKGADKALWDQLPRAHQQAIADRERARDSNTDKALREAAEKRKTADAELQAYSTQRQQYQQQLEQIVPALQASVAREFSDITSVADVQKLAAEEPERFAQWQAQQYALQMAQAEQSKIKDEQQKEQEKARSEYLSQAEQRLLETFPEWQDTGRGRREISEIHGYLADEGVPREQLSYMVEDWQYKIARKAMKYDQAQRAKTKAVQKSVPKVQKPGTAPSKADKAAEGRAARLKRLEKTGDLTDAVDLLMQ